MNDKSARLILVSASIAIIFNSSSAFADANEWLTQSEAAQCVDDSALIRGRNEVIRTWRNVLELNTSLPSEARRYATAVINRFNDAVRNTNILRDQFDQECGNIRITREIYDNVCPRATLNQWCNSISFN